MRLQSIEKSDVAISSFESTLKLRLQYKPDTDCDWLVLVDRAIWRSYRQKIGNASFHQISFLLRALLRVLGERVRENTVCKSLIHLVGNSKLTKQIFWICIYKERAGNTLLRLFSRIFLIFERRCVRGDAKWILVGVKIIKSSTQESNWCYNYVNKRPRQYLVSCILR